MLLRAGNTFPTPGAALPAVHAGPRQGPVTRGPVTSRSPPAQSLLTLSSQDSLHSMLTLQDGTAGKPSRLACVTHFWDSGERSIPFLLDLTKDSTTASFSRPWKPSTDLISSSGCL